MISIVQLGTVDYATGLRLQQQLVALRKEEKIGDVLLLLEHKLVITLGRNAKAANVIASPELLAQRGVELHETNRGGDVTFHGPEQIVGYPIFDLRGYANNSEHSNSLSSRAEENDSRSEGFSGVEEPCVQPRKHLGAVDFVRRLEEVLIRTCADFAIPTKRVPGLTGVWTDPETRKANPDSSSKTDSSSKKDLSSRKDLPSKEDLSLVKEPSPEKDLSFRAEARNLLSADTTTNAQHEAKLAAIGIHISRFVTSHGFALNVNPDLSYFNLIIPCGITSKPVTSMQQELGKPLDLNAVAESISRNFGVVFQSQILWVETLDALLGNTVGVPMKPPAEVRQLHEEDTHHA